MDEPLTNEELAQLAALGWKIGGGGTFDGVSKVQGVGHGSRVLKTRAEWRELIAVSLPNNLASEPAQSEATRADLLSDELTDLRSTLERQSREMARMRAECARLESARAALMRAYVARGEEVESERFARTRAEAALRRIGAYTSDRYIRGCVAEGLGGVNG